MESYMSKYPSCLVVTWILATRESKKIVSTENEVVVMNKSGYSHVCSQQIIV